MNKRLKELRKTLKLNQSDFAAKIGIAQSGYSQIETGENALTEQNIKLICFIYGVNDSWLRTGEGEMFSRMSKPENDDEKKLLDMFRYLSTEMKLFVLQKIQECLRVDKEFTVSTPTAASPDLDEAGQTEPDPAAEKRAGTEG
jgi:transcriptional regulator with XRE-family HTH domain